MLWLWYRPEATAPTGPLAWEPPYARGAALKRQKKKKKICVAFFVAVSALWGWIPSESSISLVSLHGQTQRGRAASSFSAYITLAAVFPVGH